MTPDEIRLKCLELALVQAKNEGKHGDVNRVVEIQTLFYYAVVPAEDEVIPGSHAPTDLPRRRGRQPKADKSIYT